MQPSGEGLTEDFIIRVDSLDVAAGSQPVYVSFTRGNSDEYPLGGFSCLLKFVSKEVDPSSGLPEETGYDDEYQLEEVELSGGDYIVPSYCSFESEWTKLEGAAEAEEEFSLSSMASIKGIYLLLCSHIYHTHSFPFSGN
jgi:coatomer protein complex subunit gamma